MASNKEKILDYIRQRKQVTVSDLLDVVDIERAMIHRHLLALVKEGLIMKIGSAPKVVYVPVDMEHAKSVRDMPALDATTKSIVHEQFFLVTPQGERLEGIPAFVRWCGDRRFDVTKKATEYVSLSKKYSAMRKGGLLDGSTKFRKTFGDDDVVDAVYYVDFYTWEMFGKTKLGQLLLYAKQSQDKKMIRELAERVRPYVERVISKHHIEAIGYIPPTVKRTVQLMDGLRKTVRSPLPEVGLEKIVGTVRVPQKKLSSLHDRIQNARAGIFVSDRRAFGTVLLIDDAVGSGATFNETARKLKEQGVAKKVICLSVVGSLKGFDVISEV